MGRAKFCFLAIHCLSALSIARCLTPLSVDGAGWMAGRRAVQVTAGGSHTCALLDDASVKCWGANESGELGLEDTHARGDAPGEMGDDLPAVSLGTGRHAVAVSAGAANHTCALLDDGSVRCWGANDFGQLGLGDVEPRGDDPHEMGDELSATDLGAGTWVVGVEAGGGYSCAVLNDGSARCWGFNGYGNLGLGDHEHRGDGPSEMGEALPPLFAGPGRRVAALAPS
ncbi:MAG: hypothetical protein OXU20_39435 [Myxococcales bacterium]|nr:hypothetical protein [Myxococcales bacterium]MDD9968520.1 hypothetical protein [Myxococcales bacterium]